MAEVLSVPLRTSASHTSFFDATAPYGAPRRNFSHSDLRSGSLSSSQTSSYHSTPASSLSLETGFDDSSSDDDEVLAFPSYHTARHKPQQHLPDEAPPASPIQPAYSNPSPADTSDSSSAAAPDPLLPISEDDSAVRIEPTHHVDYLSHEWNEEDIWASWRHIVEHRSVYGERSRLENASWRTWAKSQFKLKTVSPETLNWLKDCDVTWLYGPLQPASHRSASTQTSEPISRLSKSNSFLHKKPILKKRSMSEVMLQNSLSSSSLVKQAAAAVQAQQLDTTTALARRRHRPAIGRATSDYVTSSIPSRTTSRDPTDYYSSRSTSGLHTPDHGERKHIRFDEKVEQCIAVECKDAIDDDDEDDNIPAWRNHDDDESSDEGVVMMKRSRKRKPISRVASKANFNGETKIIAKLPSTTLKSRTDSPDPTEQQPSHSLGLWRSSRLSPSPSQETLRPSNPSTNFLLADEDEDEDEDDDPWEPANAFEVKRPSTPTAQNPTPRIIEPEDGESSQSAGLRRTASGMFMPFDEMDDDPTTPGIIGRVVDTVNTARDIAHVIWNVGWRS